MRVLIIGRRKKISVESGLRRALTRAGHTVAHVDDRKLRQNIGARAGSQWLRLRWRLFKPDRVLVFKPHDVTTEVLDQIAQRTPTTMWYRDLTVPPDSKLVRRARNVETVFLTAGGQAQEWQTLGAKRALWLPDGADRDLDRPVEPHPSLACDIAFIGRGYDEQRAEFLCRLAEHFHVRVWGQDWQRWANKLNWDGSVVYGEDFARVCASARIVIDIKPAHWSAEQVGTYSSNRLVRQLSCGGFVLTTGTAESKQLFRDGEHCAWYDSEGEAIEKITYYLQHAEKRALIAAAGSKLVHDHHMLDHRIPNLLTGAPFVNPLADS